MTIRNFYIGTAALLLASGPALAQEVEVQTINEDKAKTCRFVDTAFAQDRGHDVTDTMNKIRERAAQIAAERGGNAVVLKNMAIQSPNMFLMFDIYICS